MSANAEKVENVNFAPSANRHHESRTLSMSGEASISLLKSKALFSSAQRAEFYSGQDRMLLNKQELDRIYELEKANDSLQRSIFQKEHTVKNVSDPFVALADIEHAKMMIARNNGEILKIFDITAVRLQRIAELEKENLEMHLENNERQALWTTLHDMHERSQIASGIFLNKDLIERNELEITMLRNEAAG